MKNIVMYLTILMAILMLSVVTVFSSSGPFGAVGPTENPGTEKEITASRTTNVSGTGPYGAFGVIGTEPGWVMSKRPATLGGSGPYGSIDISGMIPDSRIRSHDECIMVAHNCTPDR